MTKQIHIIGGGTVFHVRPHLALAAPAYGRVVDDIFNAITNTDFDSLVHLYTTKMAGNRHAIWTACSGIEATKPLNLETNADIAALLDRLVADDRPKIIFLPAALCDFNATCIDGLQDGEGTTFTNKIGKTLPRLKSDRVLNLTVEPAEKIISRIRKTRKDIFLVGFKTTTGATPQEQFDAGLTLVKKTSCNLVLANDLTTRRNMVITPEQAPHYVTVLRRDAIRGLVKMTLSRAEGHFTRSTVVDGDPVPWDSSYVPASLRTVVDHCIKRGAYKPFLGSTVGHFAYKVEGGKFVTSRRKTDFNDLNAVGMVIIEAQDNDHVIAHGSKPSVGGQSQRIIFANHPDVDCIVHFHCPLKTSGVFPTRSQEPYECGSHECGQNTSDGLEELVLRPDGYLFQQYRNGSSRIKVVMLDKHGPNIVFNRNVDPQAVIDFIEDNFDLTRSTSELG